MIFNNVEYEIITDETNVKKHTSNKIGEVKKNRWGIEYKIIGYVKNNSRLRQIKFLKSGYVAIVNNFNIHDGSATDYTHPTVCGVGITGIKDASKHFLYYRWANMLGRCYSEKHTNYKSYGGKGCYVEDYLLNFKNYVNFIESLEGFELLKNNPDKYHIDKDLKNSNEKCYSRETISIITKEKNIEIENSSKAVEIEVYDLKGNFVASFASITIAEKMTGIHRGNIAKNINGKAKTAGGYVWVKKE